MNASTMKSLQNAAVALGSATKHIGAATYDVGKVVVPVAGAVLGNVPKAAGNTLDKARNGETFEERKRAATVLGIGVAVVLGLGAATCAHFVSRHKKSKAYKLQKKQVKAAIAREREIDEALADAVAVRSAKDILNQSPSDDLTFAEEPGCFAILTYDAADDQAELDLAAYRDVYVGAANNMLDGVKEQLEGKGNLYVKADVVYGRTMYVAFYPCDEEDLLNLHDDLAIVLGADESYNKVGAVLKIR